MTREPVELECFDVRERLSVRQAGHRWDAGVRAEVEEELAGDQPSRPSIVQGHLDRLWRDDTSAPHDELSAACLITLQVKCNEAIDHVSLALQDLRHIDRDRAGRDTELSGARDGFDDTGAPDFVLAWEAVDVRAGATDPTTFDYCRPLAGLCHVPREVLAAFAATDDNHVVSFRFRHRYLLPRGTFTALICSNILVSTSVPVQRRRIAPSAATGC